MLQEIADVERNLSDLQHEQLKTKELEQKATRNRHQAVEDLEKAVRLLFIIIACISHTACFLLV